MKSKYTQQPRTPVLCNNRPNDENPRGHGSGERAGDRFRTGDLQLGKLTLCQLSYARLRLAPGEWGGEDSNL